MDINFAIVKTAQDLENYALAKLINRNGWGWFESVCGELEEGCQIRVLKLSYLQSNSIPDASV